MPLVVDAPMAAAWVVADERTPTADILLGRVKVETGCVPALFWHEMRDLLVKIERRGRSRRGSAETALAALRQLLVAVAGDRSDATVLRLARRHDVTPCDAAYRDVALSTGLPLATLDRALAP